MNRENRQILLRRRPNGLVSPDDTEMVTEPAPAPGEGEVLLRTTYVGIDAAARTWLDGEPGYLPPLQLGEVVRKDPSTTVTWSVVVLKSALPIRSSNATGDQGHALFSKCSAHRNEMRCGSSALPLLAGVRSGERHRDAWDRVVGV